MLKAAGLTKSYAGEPVFADVHLTVNAGERIGLVGPNGSGKSSLLRLLAGRDRADRGSVTYGPDERVGYLDHQVPDRDQTVGAFLDEGLGELPALAEQLAAVEAAMAESGEPDPDYTDLQERWRLLGGWEARARSAEVRDRLGVAGIDPATPLLRLSGGEQARVMLARLLLEAPAILLLDEPTNHLDGDGLAWLGDFLSAYRGAVVVATHDRAFLDHTVRRIVELDVVTDRAETYEGGYSDYRAEKHRRRVRLLRDWEAQEKHHRRLAEDIERTAEQAMRTEEGTKDSKMRRYSKKVAKKAKARERRLRREMLSARWIERPEERPPLTFRFAAVTPPDQEVLRLDELVADRGAGRLWQPFSAEVRGGERVLVTGQNGTGKSTLLEVVRGRLDPASGTAERTVKFGLLPQTHDRLPKRIRVIDYLRRLVPLYEADAERLLESYLFDPEQYRRPLGTLSAGETRRLLIAALVNSGAGLLLLDEPTNYLDFESLEVLEQALEAFRGTVIAVSHDVRFGESLRPSQHWHLSSGVWEAGQHVAIRT
jgi:ATPase subunit of ABC transporter with duplicated ATPase domains